MARTVGSHSETTGPRLRKAALSLFARHGYAAVSMRQIAAEVGVQAGALYNYTPDKQSLLCSLLEGHMEDLLSTWSKTDPKTDALSRLEQFVAFHIGFHVDRTDALFISYMELRNLEPENFAHIEAMRRRYEAAVEDILLEGTENGIFVVEDPKITALAIISLLNGVLTWFRPDGRLSQDQVETIYRDMVARMLGAK